MNEVIEQLVEFYKKENWHRKRLSDADVTEYFIRLLSSGNIIVMFEDNILKGYVEFFRINSRQLVKIFDKDFYVFDENIQDGNICYINSLYVDPHSRHKDVIKYLRSIFMEVNKNCNYFIGEDTRRDKLFVFKGERNGV